MGQFTLERKSDSTGIATHSAGYCLLYNGNYVMRQQRDETGVRFETQDANFNPDYFEVLNNANQPVHAKFLKYNGEYILSSDGNPYIAPYTFNFEAFIAKYNSLASLPSTEGYMEYTSGVLLNAFRPGGIDDLQRSYEGGRDRSFAISFTASASFVYGVASSIMGVDIDTCIRAGGVVNWIQSKSPGAMNNTSGEYGNNPNNPPNIRSGYEFVDSLRSPTSRVNKADTNDITYDLTLPDSSAATTVIPASATRSDAAISDASTGYDALEQYRRGVLTAQSAEEFDAKVATLKAELTLAENQRLQSLDAKTLAASGAPITDSELPKNIREGIPSFDSEVIKAFTQQWEYNFKIIQGPTSTVFIDATLSYQDVKYGYTLAKNPNGVLWRVNAAGEPHPDDRAACFEQNRMIESSIRQTIAELKNSGLLRGLSSGTGIGGGSEADSEYARDVILTKSSDNSSIDAVRGLRDLKEVEAGPSTAINAAFSNAIYYDGSQKIPDGFRSIGGTKNSETQFYAEFFTDDKQIVVVFRGTDSWRALVGSNWQLIMGQEVEQFAYVKKAKEELKDIIAANPELQGLPISATGQSLGGANAQYFTLITGYPSETFGAPGIMNSLKAMQAKDTELDLSGVDKLPVINHVNIHDYVGTAELGGHIGVVRNYDMSPDNVIPGWNDSALLEHSMNRYQSYLGYEPVPLDKIVETGYSWTD